MDRSQSSSIIIGKLMNVGGMLKRMGDRTLQPFDLNHQQYSVFFEIAKARKVRQKDMVNRLMLEKAHVSKVVKKLHGKGLITVTPSDDDKRSAWLSPTPEGEKTVKKCMDFFRKWNREWAEAFNEEQLMSILESLDQLQKVFRDRIQSE